jgi:hypothetical protein
MIARVGEEEFHAAFRAYAWQTCDALNAVDATIEMEARSVEAPNRTVVGLIHGNLVRASPGGPFVVTIGPEQVREVVDDALTEWAQGDCAELRVAEHPARYRTADARWRMIDCPVAHTHAPRYAGGAVDILEAKLGLGSESWMQDWPLEVSDPARVEEFCAFYDRESDALVRFDAMQLALFSYDERDDNAPLSGWFERTLCRDFALHGNTVAYWAALERERDDPELTKPEPEFVFRISGLLRRVWESSLVPIDIGCKSHFACLSPRMAGW